MRFLFDVHVSVAAARELVRRGVDVVHATGAGLREASDPELLEHAIGDDRIVVTRNYRDFAPLVEALNRAGRSFPGVLFLSTSIPQGNPGAHVTRIEAWIASCAPVENPLQDTFGWIF
jgi:predicted nuclease of predicted toxin-antitoxin system